MTKLPLLAIACLIVAPALAQQTAPTADAKAKPERKTCRSEGETGSRFVKKVCHTPGEWAQIDAASQANAQNMTRNGSFRDMNHQ